MPGYRASDFRTRPKVEELSKLTLAAIEKFPVKFWWFQNRGYSPHTWQILFHAAASADKLTRFRHLVAGRRGGKTLSAAWEVLFYALHPEAFHQDAHQIDSDKPLWIWCLAKDYKVGRPSLLTMLEVIGQAGLVKDKGYTYNKTEKVIEFANGTLLEFKTADDPQSLRGAGLDILWMDEAAFIPNEEAWQVVYPALTDKAGLVISTTTPAGKNWFYDEFWSQKALDDPDEFRVEYTSIDNPYLPKEVWEKAKQNYHPIMFKQEFLAAFDAFHGVALHGDWLKHYVVGSNAPLGSPDDIRLDFKKQKLAVFIGVDPILGPLPGHAYGGGDRFSMAAIGVDQEAGQVYLIEMFAQPQMTFPDQIMKIAEWHTKYRPQLIGIESNAFQRAFVQQASRLPGTPNVIPVFAKGKKHERILAMTPLFRTGRVRIHRNHRDFIDEWVSYDPTDKNPKDDTLDAMEIALGCAGVILPSTLKYTPTFLDTPASSSQELAMREIASISTKRDELIYDPDMGADY